MSEALVDLLPLRMGKRPWRRWTPEARKVDSGPGRNTGSERHARGVKVNGVEIVDQV